jgi:hypothetical protein
VASTRTTEEASTEAGYDKDGSSTSRPADVESTRTTEDVVDILPALLEDEGAYRPRLRLGSMERKRLRSSRPTSVLQAIKTPARDMYSNPAVGKVDLSHQRPRRYAADVKRQQNASSLPRDKNKIHIQEPTSLYTIFARSLDHHTGLHTADVDFTLTRNEQDLLHQNGFDMNSVKRWAACLLEPKSGTAAQLFEHGNETPPFFVLLLLLRRQHMTRSALGVIMRHVDRRVTSEPLGWAPLKVLSVRLLRHIRKQWPESMPWIAALFAAQASAMFERGVLVAASLRSVSDITRFCNVLLLLLSLPANINPVLGAVSQEKAQFQVLQFMASRTPAITVTRLGFRSVSRNQLAHSKTAEEREWAELKGHSWPPWKEDRTAMDEEKGYEFGASRASRILHRMYDAGYRGHIWEEMVEVYAGWDTDFSPTIQTRTSLPHISSQSRNKSYITELLWSARVRSTRTRREAWACFLAYELSGAPTSQYVYLAMFEKLYHSPLERSSKKKTQSDLDEVLQVDEEPYEMEDDLLPGDMKEVLQDPTSPLHYVYLSEPIPSMQELIDRMHRQGVRPSNRLLAFFLDAAPTFRTCLDVLEAAKEDFGGGIGHLLSGQHGPGSCAGLVPDYLLAAFIQCLCRFGRFSPAKDEVPLYLSLEQHAYELRSNRDYLLGYAQTLLSRYRPLHRPAWTAYMDKAVRSYNDLITPINEVSTTSDMTMMQYETVWNLIDGIEEIDLGVDDKIFRHACAVTTFAAQTAIREASAVGNSHHLLATASRRIRQLFNNLTGTLTEIQSVTGLGNEATNTIPPHVPGPAELHAYVRALGTLRDYEGLYSFSTWLTTYHVEVTVRCKAQHGGQRLLFRTLVGLRAAVTGYLELWSNQHIRAPDDIVQLIESQIDSVEEWGGWPAQEYVDTYVKGGLKSGMPVVGGR